MGIYRSPLIILSFNITVKGVVFVGFVGLHVGEIEHCYFD